MKQLIVFPRGQLNPKDRARLSKHGFCAIEADDPSKVVAAVPCVSISGDVLSLCAFEAMKGSGFTNYETVRSNFTKNLTKHLEAAARQAPTETTKG